jgi:hypothetical protein
MEIQPLVGRKENNTIWQSIVLLPISSIGETNIPNGTNISDDELSKFTYEIFFEKPSKIYLKVRKIIRHILNFTKHLICKIVNFLCVFLR